MIRKNSIFALALVLLSYYYTYAQNVELVISSGFVEGTGASFSPDNQVVATRLNTKIRFWDVKSGREIRTVNFTDNLAHSGDSMYFSPDGKKIWVTLMASNDMYSIEVESGQVDFVQSDKPFDYSTFSYSMPNHTKGAIYLSNPSTKDLSFPSPNGKIEAIFRKVKNPLKSAASVLPYCYTLIIKQEGKESPTNDTIYFVSFAFSPDSKFLYSANKVFDLTNLNIVREFAVVPPSGASVAFLPGTHIPVTSGIDNVRIWDFPNIVDIPIDDLGLFCGTPKYDYLVCQQFGTKGNLKDYITIDLANQKEIGRNTTDIVSSYLTSVSGDASMYSTMHMVKDPKDYSKVTFNIQVIESKTGAIKKAFDFANNAFLTTDNEHVLLDSLTTAIKSYSLTKKAMEEYTLKGDAAFKQVNTISNNGNYLLGYQMKTDPSNGQAIYHVVAWEASSGKVFFQQEITGILFMGFQMSYDNKLFAFSNTSDNNDIYILETSTGKTLCKLNGHSDLVMYTAFSDDNKRLLSGSFDGTRKLWNLETGKEIASFISTGKDDYAIVTPDQYYYCTKGAHSRIHYVKGKEIFPFQQFDLKYNRPDIITERLLASNTDLIRSYNLAYKKRLKRMGFTEDMLSGDFHLPMLEIMNKSTFPLSTDKRNMTISVSSKDTKYKLDRLIVKINDVPIYGAGGINLREKSLTSHTQDISFELSSGTNKISVSVLNEKGVESLVDNLNIRYLSDEKIKPDLYLLALGVSTYGDEKFDLKYAAKDAQDLYNFYADGSAGFGEVHAQILTNKGVTEKAISDYRDQLIKSKVDDVVIVFYAGHGLLDAELNYYLGASAVNFNDPSKGGIPYESLENLLDAIPARNKFLMLDACHSGEIDKEEVMLAANAVEKTENLTFRSMPNTSVKHVGLDNSFELMKELFTDIRKSNGSMILSSAGGTEFAIEGDQWNNGVFTYCLLNGLRNALADANKDKQIMMSEINSYVREKVVELTNGRQNPTTRAEILDRDWKLK